MATAKPLDDIIECLICTEVYTDPRVLPCVHSYCLKCLERYSKDKQPGDKLACPLCRKEFTVPGNGVGDLPKNFFVDKFLQMKELSSVDSKTSLCEVCNDDEVTEKKVATAYCVECQQKLCQTCEGHHKKFKVIRGHSIVKIGDELVKETFFEALPTNCDTHEGDQLRIYCFECKLAICMMCCIMDHNSHKCTDVKQVAETFRKQMATDAEKTEDGIQKCREMLEGLEKEKSDFVAEITKQGKKISEKAERLKQMIDNHKEKLMNELSSMKQKRMKEIESLREEIERQLMSMGSYKKYVDEVRQKGTACDIARAASGLHDRADELLTFDVIERTLADLGHADVTFMSSNYVINDVCKTLGRLRHNIRKRATKFRVPTLAHIIPSRDRNSVYAVASLDDDVFIARCNSQQQIEVYDSKTFTLKHHVTVPELGSWPRALAVCAVNRCLYASAGGNNSIHKVQLSRWNAVKRWSAARAPTGLSVNKAHNLVVACCGANKIQEYTTDGSLVREICLQAGVTDPYHAIQLSTGHYVVSQYTSPGAVIVVGVDGQVIHRYGQSQTSYVGQMKGPSNLAVTKNDDIFVVDEDNNRILSIIRSTGCVQELALSVDGGIQEPRGLCLDESRGRLYVGEWGGQHRVLVFDLVDACVC